MAFTPTSNERQQAHRAGRSSAMNKRFAKAEFQNSQDAGEFGFMRSALPTIAGAALTADKAYWVYVGRCARDIKMNQVHFYVSTGGTGAQAAEVAIATGSAPNSANQTLTVVQVAATLSDLTGTGVMVNTTGFSYVPDIGAHLWLGLHVNMASTQPTVYGHTFDCSNGEILSTATAGVLAVGSTYTGSLITASVAWQAPALYIDLV